MPILFIHGVSNRASDCDYFRARGLRNEMLKRIVVVSLRDRFPTLTISDDVYWGCLGVRYHWGLRSVPPTSVLESLGTTSPAGPDGLEPEGNSDLLELLLDLAPAPEGLPTEGLETLGPKGN